MTYERHTAYGNIKQTNQNMFYILDIFVMVLDEMDGRVKDRWSRRLETQTRLQDCWKTNPAD